MDCPDPRSHISHVSVGESSVWALSRDRRVWLRNGIRAASAGDSQSLAKGTKWIEMVGELHMISMGPGDQVMGITDEEHQVVFRTGVTPSDLSGKTWKPVTAQAIRLRSNSGSSSISSQVSVQSQHHHQQPPNPSQLAMIKRNSASPEVSKSALTSAK